MQNITEAGSPPCSPQIAELELRPHLAAARVAISTSSPTLRDRSTRTDRRRGFLSPCRCEKARRVVAADAEGGLGEIVGAVGEDSAVSAISPALSAARAARSWCRPGSDLGLALLRHRLRHRVDACLDEVELGAGRDQRTITSGTTGLPVRLPASDRRLEDRARLHSAISGYTIASRQPRKPSIGLNSEKLARAIGELARIGAHRLRLVDLARRVRQELVQRRIEPAGSSPAARP